MQINDKKIDWRAEWIVRSEARHEPDDSTIWDERAEDHAKRKDMSEYAKGFLAALGPMDGASIFDMGSGSGTLAIPLAKAGHRVTCGDFSPKMREALLAKAEETGVIDKISHNALGWEDDWAAAGIKPKSADIAVASRSIMVHDLGAAIEKLEWVARHQVAITIATRFGPRAEREIGDTLYNTPYLPDFIYATNMLIDMNRYPKLKYIDSQKPTEEGGQRLVRWAFISWDVE